MNDLGPAKSVTVGGASLLKVSVVVDCMSVTVIERGGGCGRHS